MHDFEPTLSPGFIVYVRDYLLDRDLDPAPLLDRCALSASATDQLAPPVPAGQICQLFATVAEELDKPYFGIELSCGYHFESASLLILAFMAAPTVRSAFGTLLKYDKYVDSAIETKLSQAGGLGCFEATLLTPAQFDTEHLAEYLMTFIPVSLRKATRQTMPISRVAFTHELTKPRGFVEQAFGAPVVYGARHNALHFDAVFLDQPLHTANALLHQVACNALRSYYAAESSHLDFMEVVQRQVLLQFKEGVPGVASVARGLHISPRTLRRRLAEQGVKLQEVKNEARARRAKFYLQHTRLSLTEIAYELGFSELSAFSRAFKGWTGGPPQAFRDGGQAGG